MNPSVRRLLVAAGAVVAVLASHAPVRGQILGPLLPSRVMESGVAWRHLDRMVGYYTYFGADLSETRVEQSDVSAFARYGMTSSATLSFELSVTPGDIAFEDGDGQLYLAGAAIQLGLWSNEHFALSFGFHVASFFWRSERLNTCDYEAQLLDWTLLLQRNWSAGAFSGDIWVAPAISNFSLAAQRPCDDRYQSARENTGGLVGANGRLKDHLGVAAQLMWIEKTELNVALFYRF